MSVKTATEWSDYVIDLLIQKSHGKLTRAEVMEMLPVDLTTLGQNLSTLDAETAELPRGVKRSLFHHIVYETMGEFPPLEGPLLISPVRGAPGPSSANPDATDPSGNDNPPTMGTRRDPGSNLGGLA